ncbi:hypothetical protein GCM10027418_24540 [Mariniluteicoccus endophyticus]
MKNKFLSLGATLAAGALALSGCGASNSGGGNTSGGSTTGGNSSGTSDYAKTYGECKVGKDAKDVSSVQGTGEDKKKEIKLAAFNGWDESFASAHLLKAVLEKDGYKVTVSAFEAAPGFAGMSKGDIDIITDVWMPVTHPQYLEQFGDKYTHLGCWYDNAKLTIAVNDTSPAKAIEDLAKMGDQYGNKLYGIEPGAGLTKTTKEKAIPAYGLDKMDYVISSTPAMLAQVDKATKANENVAVTLWRPHWAYSAYPMRDLEDPKGSMGGTEVINNAAHKKFAEENPHAAQIVKNLALDDKQLADLENLMMGKDHFDGKDHDAAVAKWLEQNPDYIEKLKKGQAKS